MEEKREIKVKLSTVVLLFIIFTLVVALGITYYLGFVVNQNEESATNINKPENVETKIEKENNNKNDNITNSKEKEENTVEVSTKKSVELGTYNIIGEPVDPSDGSGISSITLSKNNKFTIHLVYGGEYSGKYIIDNNILVCNSEKETTYEAGTSTNNTKAIFNFKIINNKKIEFQSAKNVLEFELNKGISYSLKS